ncbi:MAG: hypothetical protein GQF41_0158 [Candidatus Rifleibacterium amylolyticum]|nr:MAG: hypothetical protein GQF41_0158 [Candidatus Rifleibacterium amylolyticum]
MTAAKKTRTKPQNHEESPRQKHNMRFQTDIREKTLPYLSRSARSRRIHVYTTITGSCD